MVSVVITTRNRRNMVLDCINSILESTYKCIEIIVVDDETSKETYNYLRNNFSNKINLIHLDNQVMMIEARNVGAKNANGNYILFVDDDNIIDSKMVENLVNCIENNENYGIVGPISFYFEDKNIIWCAGQKINLWTGKTKFMGHGKEKKYFELPDKFSDGIPNVFMIRKELFHMAGYFDESLSQDWTEPDFSFTAKKYGYETVICQNAATYHRIPISKKELNRIIIGGGFKHKAYFLTRNRFFIMKRYANLFQMIFFLLTFSWIFPMVYSLIALKYRQFDVIILYWKGFKDGLYYLLTNDFKHSV